MPTTPEAPGPHRDRATTARRAADALDAARPRLASLAALVGFDGFIDSIVHMVDVRHDMSPTGYTRLSTIPDFARRCADAAGKSTNIEQVLLDERFGGNGPLMAGALGALGVPVDFVGAVASPDHPGHVHPVFRAFAERCRRVVPVAPPSHTLCLEFDDGKLMFNNTASVQAVTWDTAARAAGPGVLESLARDADLIGVVNWSLMGGVPGIFRALCERLAAAPSRPGQRIYIDLSDPAKRTDLDLAECLGDLTSLSAARPLTLGLNLAESQRISRVAGAGAYQRGQGPDDIIDAASRLRERLGLDTVVIHPREGAAAADPSGAAWFSGPFTPTPALSTGAGDHFNAGFALARALGLPLPESLAAATAVSGAYVRDAQSPTLDRLTAFLRDLPECHAAAP
ncbi:MAG: hypothetical protein HRU70_02470 [Phycisphaeraceae bacterium]|nr:MAG: hypothetical protein HRU70_02470 [Phycisphaeraceae bacterium]